MGLACSTIRSDESLLLSRSVFFGEGMGVAIESEFLFQVPIQI